MMEDVSVVPLTTGNDFIDLPPGFRFHPTDEEIITHYLSEKVVNNNFTAKAVGEVDMNKYEPWDLPKKAKMGEKEWYFFCQRDRKYPTGMRTNRATDSGYWKATGKDKEIYKGNNCLVGMKKTLVFYRGRAPKGEKTNWVMHEYRLEGKFSCHNFPTKTAKDEWVVCRVFHKSTGIKRSSISDLLRMKAFENDLLMDSPSLPPLLDLPYSNTNRPGSSFIDNEDKFKRTTTSTPGILRMSDGTDYYHQLDNNITNHHQGTNPYMYSPHFPFQASSNLGYLHQEMNNSGPSFTRTSGFTDPNQVATATLDNYSLNRQCKVEQFSYNHSMVSLSQDTGLSNDINTENSSVVTKQDMGSTRSYEDHDDVPSSSVPVVDLECLWNY